MANGPEKVPKCMEWEYDYFCIDAVLPLIDLNFCTTWIEIWMEFFLPMAAITTTFGNLIFNSGLWPPSFRCSRASNSGSFFQWRSGNAKPFWIYHGIDIGHNQVLERYNQKELAAEHRIRWVFWQSTWQIEEVVLLLKVQSRHEK